MYNFLLLNIERFLRITKVQKLSDEAVEKHLQLKML